MTTNKAPQLRIIYRVRIRQDYYGRPMSYHSDKNYRKELNRLVKTIHGVLRIQNEVIVYPTDRRRGNNKLARLGAYGLQQSRHFGSGRIQHHITADMPSGPEGGGRSEQALRRGYVNGPALETWREAIVFHYSHELLHAKRDERGMVENYDRNDDGNSVCHREERMADMFAQMMVRRYKRGDFGPVVREPLFVMPAARTYR
jgi:hypothetical protein